MLLHSLANYQRDRKRLGQIVAVLIRYGLAEQLQRYEPDFVKRFLRHEDVGDLAQLALGERVRLACQELGPTFIKFGQVLSTRPDVVSREVANALQALQSNTEPSPEAQVVALIESELEGSIDGLFAEFERKPLASASIGQVHRATLQDGRRVVVKVQHPGIEEMVKTDLDILIHLARFLEERDETIRSYNPARLAEESKRTLMRELDFRRELRNQQSFERNFADNPDVHIPGTVPERSSQRVLTMELLDGYSIGDKERLKADGQDPSRLARIGADAFLSMVFEHRLFHADPHPGNVFVLQGGRIGLLDFGMVGRLDDDLLDDLIDLLVGFVKTDGQAIGRAVQNLAAVPADCDTAALRRDLAEMQLEFAETPIDQLDVAQVLEQFTALVRTHRVRMPPSIGLLIKVLIMLDGTSRELDRNFSLMDLLQPHCERAIQQRHSPRAQMRKAISAGRDWSRFLERLPGTLDELAQNLQKRDLSLNLQHRGMEATVDRLVSGILCAAMLLGGSLLWALKAPPTLLGVSILGLLATAVALVHGIRLLLQLGRRS